MDARFVCDPLRPIAATCDTARMASGEPGLPRQFLWRGNTIDVSRVIRSWRETGACSSGAPERYVRKHWYELATTHGVMRVYFERQARGGRKAARWWLYSVQAAGSEPGGVST